MGPGKNIAADRGARRARQARNQKLYRDRKRAGKCIIPWAAEPEDLKEFFHLMCIAVPPNPTLEDFAACLDALVQSVIG